MVTHDPHAASYADAQFHLEKGSLLPSHPMAGLEAVADVRKQTAH
jgi:ABC-type lipoprotein export system ATPase subunit